MNTVEIFPTLLHTGIDVLSAETLAALTEQVQDKQDIGNEQAKVAAVEFSLNALAAQHVALDQYSDIEITEMWANVLPPGGHHWDHTHANHILSGIIYLTDRCFTIFGDPRPAASVLAPVFDDPPKGHIRSYVHRGDRNSIVLFPSWLPHRVATTPQIRKTIAFNVILRGCYGSELSREQARL